MSKNLNNINNTLINNEEFVSLELYILVIRYLEEALSYFIKISIKNDNKKDEIDTKKLKIFNSKKEKNFFYRKSRKIPKLLIILLLLVYLSMIIVSFF